MSMCGYRQGAIFSSSNWSYANLITVKITYLNWKFILYRKTGAAVKPGQGGGQKFFRLRGDLKHV